MNLFRNVSVIDGDFSRKSQNFRTPLFLHPTWRGSTWNWIRALGVRKLEWWGYRADKEVWRYLQPSGLWTQCTNVSDGRTDGHRATAKTALSHSVAHKNALILLTLWWIVRDHLVSREINGEFLILINLITGNASVSIKLWWPSIPVNTDWHQQGFSCCTRNQPPRPSLRMRPNEHCPSVVSP